MVSLTDIRQANAAVEHSSSPPPTAVFVGGTSGIGQGMVEVFANSTRGNSHIIIVGRNREAAEKILASLPKPDSGALSREFVQCDATLMKNVEKASQDILSRFPKINYLIMSPGMLALTRDDTAEGIDKKLAVHYYARWKFLNDLLPGLKRAKDDGEQAAVMSVLAAGKGGPIDLSDLSLAKTYSISKAATVACTYNDMMMESFAEKEPRIPFIHSYPGFVRTSLFAASPSWVVRKASPIVLALTAPLGINGRDSGEYMWHGIFSTATKPGAWRIGSRGEDVKKQNYHGSDMQRKALWEHTLDLINNALASK